MHRKPHKTHSICIETLTGSKRLHAEPGSMPAEAGEVCDYSKHAVVVVYTVTYV